MTTDYDPIAEQYKRSKEQPWRTFIESHTLLELVGDPTGLSVLDVACGEGYYSRRVKQLGADSVAGVDLSREMIELARQQETEHKLGIDYEVGDARELNGYSGTDLVVAAYLLNYARNKEELFAMSSGIVRALKPGGRFVTVNCSPFLNFPAAPCFRKYGFETSVAGEWREEAPITWTFYVENGKFLLENYYLSTQTHEETFREAGFSEVRWHRPQLARAALETHAASFWSEFLEHSPIAFIECLK